MPKKPPSTIRIEGDTAYIFLKDGFEVAIDTADISLVSARCWRLLTIKNKSNKYACTGQTRDGNFTTLHRYLDQTPTHLKIDHRDGDGLNNRRNNLRRATGTQNNANSSKSRRNRSGIKGVAIINGPNPFRAGIGSNKNYRLIGYFKTAEEASAAYLSAAEKAWGEFARK